MTPDLLYVVKPNAGDELRYSLRSVAENLPHGRVWIASPQKPAWLSDGVLHIKTHETRGQKWANIPAALLMACAETRSALANRMVYLNDDFFVMEPVDEMPLLIRGRLADGGKGTGAYAKGFRDTERVLRELGVEGDLLNYELHVPFPFYRPAMLTALTAASAVRPRVRCLHVRSLYGNLWATSARQMDDVKVHGRHGALDRPFLSTNDTSFATQPVGKAIRAAFPNPGPYERA